MSVCCMLSWKRCCVRTMINTRVFVCMCMHDDRVDVIKLLLFVLVGFVVGMIKITHHVMILMSSFVCFYLIILLIVVFCLYTHINRY